MANICAWIFERYACLVKTGIVCVLSYVWAVFFEDLFIELHYSTLKKTCAEWALRIRMLAERALILGVIGSSVSGHHVASLCLFVILCRRDLWKESRFDSSLVLFEAIWIVTSQEREQWWTGLLSYKRGKSVGPWSMKIMLSLRKIPALYLNWLMMNLPLSAAALLGAAMVAGIMIGIAVGMLMEAGAIEGMETGAIITDGIMGMVDGIVGMVDGVVGGTIAISNWHAQRANAVKKT
jgi:hypothetical protein